MTAASETPLPTASELFARGSADDLASSHVSAIVVEADNALTALRKRAAELRAAALDPAFASDAVATASAEAAAIDLEGDRMENCAMRLRDRAKALAAEEADAPRWDKYNRAKATREAAATALVEAYPTLAEQLAVLLRNAREADILVGHANADLPGGAQKLDWTHPLSSGDSRFGRVSLPACDASDREHWSPNAGW